MGTWEWPLILFTVLGQTAVGIILSLWWLVNKKQQSSLNNSVLASNQNISIQPFTSDQRLLKNSILTSGILLVLAMVISVFHLGHPQAAYRALTNLSTSWLSREILFFILTFAAWFYLFRLSSKPGSTINAALGLTAGIGILGIISSALIYTLPRVPAWNNAAPVIFFLLTSVILGTLTMAALGRKTLTAGEISQLLVLALGSLIVSVILFIFYVSLLNNSSEGTATVQFLLKSPVFWLRAIVGWIIPVILLLSLGIKRNELQPHSIVLVFACGLIGELLGRALFYLSAVGIHITARF